MEGILSGRERGLRQQFKMLILLAHGFRKVIVRLGKRLAADILLWYRALLSIVENR